MTHSLSKKWLIHNVFVSKKKSSPKIISYFDSVTKSTNN